MLAERSLFPFPPIPDVSRVSAFDPFLTLALGVLLGPMNEDAATWVAAAMLTAVMVVLWMI